MPSPHASYGGPRGRPSVSGKTVKGAGVAHPGGRGKDSKGLGKGRGFTSRRHRKIAKDNIQSITKPDIRRLARRGGVKRISAAIYEETRVALKAYLEKILLDITTIVDYKNRKTVTVADVIFSLRRQGRPIYGFGQDWVDDQKLKAAQKNSQAQALD
ncbi:hypothetical protein HYFRA_00005216 [Hymenoscyphus fraxineus]|uniref:Histone H4 n=1 Tax=Hymenoscyphus fraxineus TaxID=746836 RepID=A0A9N9Q0I6_9HELO|nr:hypothetical protein HYFRA_00005216 [Hymenoscyphus fraxineus]